MAWWFRRREGEGRSRKVVIAEGLWIKCEACREIVYRAEVERNARTCPKCRAPFRIGARERLELLLDPGSFEERDAGLRSQDPLGFKDTRRYRDRLRAAREKTGQEEAVVSGTGRIEGHQIAICVFEFAFMGGSMASAVGEKVTRAVEFAARKRLPLVIVSCSGGARMQEGILSLMQMAKTAAALHRLAEERVPYIAVLTDPTTGGVMASFASLGDIIVAEPKALIGFAGPRVIAETIRQPLPDGFQRSEFLLEHGMVDLVTERKELRELLRRILAFFAEPSALPLP
ncbi:MAG: acetyl-CoA carboxylase carboxyltransferase subunit beta [Candidatus Rokubacteria bacterium]|nr:acetyl-CoA carboxylase carboxyltransferase subunit beta [Candidatus Rokubacteria bacterium]